MPYLCMPAYIRFTRLREQVTTEPVQQSFLLGPAGLNEADLVVFGDL